MNTLDALSNAIIEACKQEPHPHIAVNSSEEAKQGRSMAFRLVGGDARNLVFDVVNPDTCPSGTLLVV